MRSEDHGGLAISLPYPVHLPGCVAWGGYTSQLKNAADAPSCMNLTFWCSVVGTPCSSGRYSGISIFDVKDASRTGRTIVENVDKTTEIFEIDYHISGRSITQELKIDHKTVCFKPFKQSWIQKEARCLGATPINTKKHDGPISICEALAKWKETNPFLKRMVTEDKK
ncbi:histone-lysine N-methyltransferase SETMAR [Trichonephila clavipes]|uniref:Histone-lysine N-methyltransferase SETMAR n=1 Tax=Trichonephila clavipes TaxID=2585209 RepID=A0A8X7BNJ7_TRICX|nr:histone-lysine N-methyltransferase SETMAR [Trichonephila clavipes]